MLNDILILSLNIDYSPLEDQTVLSIKKNKGCKKERDNFTCSAKTF